MMMQRRALSFGMLFFVTTKAKAMMPWDKKHDVSTTQNGVTIEDIWSDESPAFERCYTVKLDERATLRIAIKTFLGDRRPSGELKQPDGKWVRFDPHDIAERILDRTLVPLVEDRCREIIKLDRDFASDLPNEFTDKSGQRWRKI